MVHALYKRPTVEPGWGRGGLDYQIALNLLPGSGTYKDYIVTLIFKLKIVDFIKTMQLCKVTV